MGLTIVKRERMSRIRFRCPQCAEKHVGLPPLAFRAPDDIVILDEKEQNQRAHISSDLCILDDRRYFIRCVLRLPVQGVVEVLEYGLWVEIARQDFCRYAIYLTGREEEASWALLGQIANHIPAHGGLTLGLACRVSPAEEEGCRPLVNVVDARHPLYDEQREGLTLSRLSEVISHRPGFFLIMD